MKLEAHTGHPFGEPPPLEYYADNRQCYLRELVNVPDGPLYVFGVSGGKDSDALFLWALYESGLPWERLVFTFADTGNEHIVTYLQIEQHLNERHPVIWIVPGLDFWELVKYKRMFPSRMKRYCTQFLKMQPAQRFAHALVNAGYDVTLYSGVRASESVDRAKLPEREWDSFFALDVVRPLLRWTLADVLAIHKRYDLPLNPLYGWGAKRVGCFPCINSVKAELRMVPVRAPEQIEKIAEHERWLHEQGSPGTFFHRNTCPPRFRTKPHVTKDGEKMRVATIHDILRWAEWKNPRELAKEKKLRETNFVEDKFLGCTSSMGACE